MALRICNCYLKCLKGIISKPYKQELWFLCSARNLMILSICMKFKKISLTVFMSSTDMILSQNCFLQVQREITKKIHNQELWLLCSAHCLMMLMVILV